MLPFYLFAFLLAGAEAATTAPCQCTGQYVQNSQRYTTTITGSASCSAVGLASYCSVPTTTAAPNAASGSQCQCSAKYASNGQYYTTAFTGSAMCSQVGLGAYCSAAPATTAAPGPQCVCSARYASNGQYLTTAFTGSSMCSQVGLGAYCSVPATTAAPTATGAPCQCSAKYASNGQYYTTAFTGSAICSQVGLGAYCSAPTTSMRGPTSTSVSTTSTSTSSYPTTSSTTSSATSTSTTSSTTRTSTSSSGPTPTKSSGKRGLSYNEPNYTDFFSLSGQSSKVNWAYNWYSSPYSPGYSTGYNPALTFVPMLWSGASDLTSVWVSNVNNAIQNYGADAVLGFNEPDGCEGGGSCMDVQTAVRVWKQYMEPFAGRVKLGAPAVTNGGAPMGFQWYTSFVNSCTGCHIDFVPIHWYGDCSQQSGIQDFYNHVGEAHDVTGGKQLWVTEFGCTTGNEQQVQAFLKQVIPWLDNLAWVDRYAYFMGRQGLMINDAGTGLSAQGQIVNSYVG
ncbi:glycoside hydrolase family 128 protein [Aplosporella prunicola CBS 121167]|uniref:Glycoside hydrolase family 128 protein n=1 Tax=Aplosporella prunicola CBS 121167 TaxID=1176127 RepID=A0A6A6B6P0_9PEZI|nr:glycoside hydrolase family 128 protein [Aplosporella prunicola CBS 121167]KAF2139802.1 glycoside hydrolase family 128 protein [Aplosporella prunicola CBS 121167]